ncbi:ArpU family transcriptional regulator [Enterococcus cecorum]|uniref:ArpU family transcriptional regulator n=1 Tax=Enterococcus cecorum TaxID=44008 RepID=UPI0024915284|nr:ArpU family transcriptional regulator [Enterococcus cecorum]CAI3252120.1 ArpU family transcriptional regulator [Enterococcus cecorum]
MAKFDINKYKEVSEKEVDMKKTKHNLGIFLNAYFKARERVGMPREPKITATLSEIPVSSGRVSREAEDILIYNEQAKEELLELHELFIRGYSAIQHPFKPDIAMRRKKIFMDRFVRGYSVYVTAQRSNVSEDLVTAESNEAIAQFCNELDILEYKKG